MTQQDALSKNIIKELGLDALPADQQADTLLKIGEIINQRIIVKALDSLSDEDKDAFDAILGKETENPEAIITFLRSKIPNFDGMVAKEISDFKQSSIDFLNKVTS
ncbi:MAG: DUF5663 domain-containing protein [Candidatus Jorgensenbacteria bacterium]|nr:DUF5663 domain-containing protein [Candidatus Jorgensenbacteria bacterium]